MLSRLLIPCILLLTASFAYAQGTPGVDFYPLGAANAFNGGDMSLIDDYLAAGLNTWHGNYHPTGENYCSHDQVDSYMNAMAWEAEIQQQQYGVYLLQTGPSLIGYPGPTSGSKHCVSSYAGYLSIRYDVEDTYFFDIGLDGVGSAVTDPGATSRSPSQLVGSEYQYVGNAVYAQPVSSLVPADYRLVEVKEPIRIGTDPARILFRRRRSLSDGPYNALIRMRVGTELVPLNNPVLTYRLEDTNGTEVWSETLTAGDLNSIGAIGYTTYYLSVPDSIIDDNVLLYPFITYHGFRSIWIDWIGLQSDKAEDVLAGEYRHPIKSIALSYIGHSSFLRHIVIDEPEPMVASTVGKVIEVLDSVGGQPGYGSINRHQDPRVLEWIFEDADREELLVNIYPFGRLTYEGCANDNPPSPDIPDQPDDGIEEYISSGYNGILQDLLEYYRTGLANARAVALSHNVDFWVYMQTFSEYIVSPFPGNPPPACFNYTEEYGRFRPPSAAETKLQGHLAVAYGAKGLLAFLYLTVPYGNTGYIVGLTSDMGTHTSNTEVFGMVSRYSGYKDRWDALSDLYGYVDEISPILLTLQSTYAYSSDMSHPNFSYVTEVYKPRPNGGVGQISDVEVGEFVSTTPGNDDNYVMIVNRMARPNDTRDFRVRLVASSEARYVKDARYDMDLAILFPGETDFDITLGPGEGLLYRISLNAGGLHRSRDLQTDGQQHVEAESEELPRSFVFRPPSPNPSDDAVTLRYELPTASDVRIAAFDMLGREVAVIAEAAHGAGYHTEQFDTSRLPSGTYTLVLEADSYRQSHTISVIH